MRARRRPTPPLPSAPPVALLFALVASAVVEPASRAQGRPAKRPDAALPPAVDKPADSIEQKVEALLGGGSGLTAAEVARRAQATSFEVEARRRDVEAAAAAVDQAFVGYFPRLAGLARYTRQSEITPTTFQIGVVPPPTVPPSFVQPIPAGTPLFNPGPQGFKPILNVYQLQAGLQVPISDYLLRISQSYAAAQRSVDAARENARATRLRIGADAKVAYYGWVRARLQIIVAEQALATAEAHLHDVKQLFEATAASKADVMRVESQVAQAELVVAQTQNLSHVAEEQLRTLMHDAATAPYDVGEDVRRELPPIADGTKADGLLREAMGKRLEIRALGLSAASLDEQAKAQRSVAYPRLDGFANVYYADPNARYFPPPDEMRATWDVGAQITWAPNDLFSGGAAARQLEARAASTESQRRLAIDQLRLEVNQALQQVADAEAALRSTQKGLAAAVESYRVRRELFRSARATNVELLDAETDLTRARLEAVNAHVDQRIARVRLEHAVGRDVDGGP